MPDPDMKIRVKDKLWFRFGMVSAIIFILPLPVVWTLYGPVVLVIICLELFVAIKGAFWAAEVWFEEAP